MNGHLLFVQCEGREINFYISHALCGGRGAQPWVMTTVYQYIIEKYHVVPNAPTIRKPDSPLLPGEAEEPTLEMLGTEQPIFRYKSKKPAVLGLDYLNGMYNPFKRKPNFRLYTFAQKDILSFVKNNDSSVASFFLVVMAKALDKVLPEKIRVIGGETAHNPTASLGMPHSHIDLLSHVHLDYTREQLQWDMEKLGTMTRGQIALQTDPSVSFAELRKEFCFLEELETIHGSWHITKSMIPSPEKTPSTEPLLPTIQAGWTGAKPRTMWIPLCSSWKAMCCSKYPRWETGSFSASCSFWTRRNTRMPLKLS